MPYYKKLKGRHLDSFILQKCAQTVYIGKNQILWVLNCIASAKVSMGLSGGFPYNASYRFRNRDTASGDSTRAIIIIISSNLKGTELENEPQNISTLLSN